MFDFKNISGEVSSFVTRNGILLVVIITALLAFFIINDKLSRIQISAQSTYKMVDKTLGEGSELEVKALMDKAEASQNEIKKIGLVALSFKTLVGGMMALLIMSIINYSFTKIDFSKDFYTKYSFVVLSAIAFGSLILVGLIFSASEMKGQTPSDLSINCIKSFEGYRAKPYKDAVGVWTDGWGNTHNVVPNKIKSKAEATLDLAKNLNKFSNGIKSRITRRLEQHEFDALVSFTYNLGYGVLKGQLQNDINYNFANLVESRIKLYNKAGGRVLGGLVRRRETEARIYVCDCKYIRKFVPYYARCT